MLIKESAQHLSDNNMTYSQHFIFAFSHASRCIIFGGLLLVHSIVPAVFQKAGSTLTTRLSRDFTVKNENY